MFRTKFFLLVLMLHTGLLLNCQNKNQNKLVGGPCEGCEAIYEYGDKVLKTIDTLPDFKKLPHPIKISGIVYKNDGKTPAKDVILYVYHTNDKGIYPKREGLKGWGQRHGYLRGWMKTGNDGRYTFYSSRPASYPNTTIPQHIHITVKEPHKNEYYLADYYFSDDPYLPSNIKSRTNHRGGNGIITLQLEGDLLVANRDLILGKNIPNY